jgi:hypothetical protein
VAKEQAQIHAELLAQKKTPVEKKGAATTRRAALLAEQQAKAAADVRKAKPRAQAKKEQLQSLRETTDTKLAAHDYRRAGSSDSAASVRTTTSQANLAVADEVTEEYAAAMDDAIHAAAKAESECDKLAAQVKELEAHLDESRLSSERTRILFPIAHHLVAKYDVDFFMHSYAEAATASSCDHTETVKVPESAKPVRLDDPLCRAEMVRILRSLGYHSELLDTGVDGFPGVPGSPSTDFQITAREGTINVCSQCDSEWKYDLCLRDGGEWHHPGCVDGCHDV